MSEFWVALLLSVGFSAWVYRVLRRSAGSGNGGTAVAAAAVAGVIMLVVSYSLAKVLL
jgi:hypothetical protein